MEGALVVGSQVGDTDMLPSGTRSLRETMAELCEAGAEESRVIGPPPSTTTPPPPQVYSPEVTV